MSDLVILGVEDNSAPSYRVQLKRQGVVIDLTHVTRVDCFIVRASTGEIKNAANTQCSVSDAPNGIVIVSYADIVFDEGGRYVGEFKLDGETLHETLQLPIRERWGS